MTRLGLRRRKGALGLKDALVRQLTRDVREAIWAVSEPTASANVGIKEKENERAAEVVADGVGREVGCVAAVEVAHRSSVVGARERRLRRSSLPRRRRRRALPTMTSP